MPPDNAQDILKATEVAIAALPTIQRLARSADDKARDALQTIDAIIESLLEGLAGRTTPDVVEAELKALADRVTSDERLNGKFDYSNSGDDV